MKILIINVVQSITFNVNPRLADVTLNCSAFVINVNITDFDGEKLYENWKKRKSVSKLVGI